LARPPAWAEGDAKVIGFPVVTDRDLKRLAALTCDLASGFPLSTADFRRFAGIIELKPP
jgi:hypothetical protein